MIASRSASSEIDQHRQFPGVCADIRCQFGHLGRRTVTRLQRKIWKEKS
jgi:hypothetical protein